MDSTFESTSENKSRLQNLRCLTIPINVFNSKIGRDYVEIFRVFARPLGVNFGRKLNFQKIVS